jgi:hydroxypyruvate reductase
VVGGRSWAAIAAAGLAPAVHLTRHDAYPALDAAGALIRTGSTGTNVADLAIGLVLPA